VIGNLLKASLCSGGSGVYIGGQWGGHNYSWGSRIYIATVNHH